MLARKFGFFSLQAIENTWIFIFFFLRDSYWCFACLYICVLCTCRIYRGQKRILNSLELEFQEVVNCHVDAGD